MAILCVDDELIILQSLARELQRAFGNQYLYEFAEDPNEALEIIAELQSNKIEVMVVVSDWLMPGTKGNHFLIQLHQQYPHITKIMLTGQAPAEAIQLAKEKANLYDYLFKPWSEQELINTLKNVLTQP